MARVYEMRDSDGEPLLFMDDIEKMTGWERETVKHYATTGRRARREQRATARDMPEESARVRRQIVKGDGKPLVVITSVWRRDRILAWLKARGVKVIGG